MDMNLCYTQKMDAAFQQKNGAGFKYDRFQLEAFGHIDQGHSVIVSAPTGAGKTTIAEYAIERAIKRGEKIIYTSPIKALSNQKFRDFSKKYSGMVGLVTGDVSINPDADLVIMTTEIYRNTLFERRISSNLSWVIFDEIHYIDDEERGSVWEESIMFSSGVRFVFLSATIPNIHELASWISSVQKAPVQKVLEPNRPVPLKMRYEVNGKLILNRPLQPQDFKSARGFMEPASIENLVRHLFTENLFPALYFCFGRKRVEQMALFVSRLEVVSKERNPDAVSMFWDLCAKYEIQDQPGVKPLSELVEHGTAYHHAGMIPSLKEVVEVLYTHGLINMIFTTETFALGINMPVKAVIFDELRKIYGNNFTELRTRDFYQMAGRSGRRGIDTVGYVYSRINPRYISFRAVSGVINGSPEPVRSQFNTSYGTLLNLYTRYGDELEKVYAGSLHYYQSSKKGHKFAIYLLRNRLKLLKDEGFIFDGKLTVKGLFTSKMYGYELIMAGMFENDLFSRFNAAELCVLMAAVVYEPRGREKSPVLSEKTMRLKDAVDPLSKEVRKLERKYNAYTFSKMPFYNICDAVRLWAAGASFHETLDASLADEGEIVRYMRMVIQMLRQTANSDMIAPEIQDRCHAAVRLVKRGVVDADKQIMA